MACEIAYLHNNDIVHGDICPENIIVVETSYNTIYNYEKCTNKYLYSKLIGLSSCTGLVNCSKAKESDPNIPGTTVVNKSMIEQQPIVEGCCGNLLYTAPEVIDQGGYDHKADIFSLGVLIYWLLTSEYPYEQLSTSGRNFMVTGLNLK